MIPSIPKLTTPMTKFIRTLEGVVILAANITLVVVPVVTTSLSATQAVKYGVILDSVAVIARTVLKAVAVAQPLTPAQPAPALFTGPQLSSGNVTSGGTTFTLEKVAAPKTAVDQAPAQSPLEAALEHIDTSFAPEYAGHPDPPASTPASPAPADPAPTPPAS